ncbi:MAG: hypothetical protein Q9191_007446 [Dirinaria sp. TL-2023a]
MSQVGTRKRPAPGTSPVNAPTAQIVTQKNGTSANQDRATTLMATDDYLHWPQQGQSSYPDSADNNGSNLYNGVSDTQGMSTNQLARRLLNQDLISRPNYNAVNNEAWPVLADGAGQSTDGGWINEDDDLERLAEAAKRENQAKRKQIPPFVQKLSSFLDKDQNTDLIRWSDKGDSFIVVDEDDFARKLIPELFKHSNYASFVRQLNMYGFHKKVGLSDNSMRASERKNKSPSEYYHPYFRRGRPNLLWLIQKPKTPQSKNSGKGGPRLKQDDANQDEDGEETYDVDSPDATNRGQDNGTAQRSSRRPLMIGNSGRGQTPSQDEMAAIQQELAAVRQNQKVISNVLQQIARDNERQAQAYKQLHDRHESSINAILTFLATVYNRSLSEGQGGQNFGSVLGGAFPQDTQPQGNVVDMGDYNEQNASPAQRFFRKQPLLLKAPPSRNAPAAQSPNAGASSQLSPNQAQQYQSPSAANSPAVQELFSPATSLRSSQSPQVHPTTNDNTTGQPLPEADIMSLINNHNAQNTFPPGTRMDFPEALSHLQNADGKTPLTPNQRNNVLQLMAGSNTDPNTPNNALTSPNPPDLPETNQFDMTRDQLEFLGNAIKNQEQKVESLTQTLAPLSPSGSIPGMNDSIQYNNADLLDMDSIFNSGDYFNDNIGGGGLDFGNNNNIPDFSFDGPAESSMHEGQEAPPSQDGTADEKSDRGSGIETLGSSEVTSPANTSAVEESGLAEQQHQHQQPPQEEYGRGKRRKRN